MKLMKAIVHLIFLVAFNSGASLIGHLPSPTRGVCTLAQNSRIKAVFEYLEAERNLK